MKYKWNITIYFFSHTIKIGGTQELADEIESGFKKSTIAAISDKTARMLIDFSKVVMIQFDLIDKHSE